MRLTVAGGGIAGLSLAWELVTRGREVVVVEAGRIAGEASLAATSYMEPRFGRGASRRLEWAALARWPDYAEEIGAASGIAVGLRHGQWRIAFADDEARVRADMEKRRGLGWHVEWVDGGTLRERLPQLAPEVTGAAAIRDPAWVDGPAVCAALAAALRAHGATLRENERLQAVDGATVLALGAGANDLAVPGLPRVRRLKGTSLFYAAPIALPRMLRHPDVSIVPRPDGVVIGASKEPDATSLTPDPAVVADLHARACRVLPALADVAPEPEVPRGDGASQEATPAASPALAAPAIDVGGNGPRPSTLRLVVRPEHEALDSGDPEDEHSCFSDNTHRDFVRNVDGIALVWGEGGANLRRVWPAGSAAAAAVGASQERAQTLTEQVHRHGPVDVILAADDTHPGRQALSALSDELVLLAENAVAAGEASGLDVEIRGE